MAIWGPPLPLYPLSSAETVSVSVPKKLPVGVYVRPSREELIGERGPVIVTDGVSLPDTVARAAVWVTLSVPCPADSDTVTSSVPASTSSTLIPLLPLNVSGVSSFVV